MPRGRARQPFQTVVRTRSPERFHWLAPAVDRYQHLLRTLSFMFRGLSS